MGNVIQWVILGILGAGALAYLIYKIVQISKMSPEQRKEAIVTYLMGLVALAERNLGAGKGAEKLASVESYFKKHAPILIKVLLATVGKDTLGELIEFALQEIKKGFEK